MGNYYSAVHIADDHIHADITYNIEEPQQKYRLGTVSNRLLGAKTSFTGSKPHPTVKKHMQNIYKYLISSLNTYRCVLIIKLCLKYPKVLQA